MYHLLYVIYFLRFTMDRDLGRPLIPVIFVKVYLYISISILYGFTSSGSILFICIYFMVVVDLFTQILIQ